MSTIVETFSSKICGDEAVFNTQNRQFLKNVEELKDKIYALKNEQLNSTRDFVKQLNWAMPIVKGTKVKITWERYHNGVSKTVTGFYNGFDVISDYKNYKPILILQKVKKDGTMSKNQYPAYDVPDYDKIVDIEILK